MTVVQIQQTLTVHAALEQVLTVSKSFHGTKLFIPSNHLDTACPTPEAYITPPGHVYYAFFTLPFPKGKEKLIAYLYILK